MRRRLTPSSSLLLLLGVMLLLFRNDQHAHAFSSPPPRKRGNLFAWGGDGDHSFDNGNAPLANVPSLDPVEPWPLDDDHDDNHDDSMLAAAATHSSSTPSNTNNQHPSSSSPLQKARSQLARLSQRLTTPVSNVWGRLTNRQQKPSKEEALLLEQLQTMPIQNVILSPASSVLPPEVVRLAVRQSGLLGHPLQSDRVQRFATLLSEWYQRQGYLLHGVVGATLQADTATAEITVDEPRVDRNMVNVTIVKEMVLDEENPGQLLTFKQYRNQCMSNQATSKRLARLDLPPRHTWNTTFVPSSYGRTKPHKIAKAMRLTPGQPFQWDAARWNQLMRNSGLFAKVLHAAPTRVAPDGDVQFHIYATEPPPRHLEYGVGKSLYTGSWEGELDFTHGNCFGGGETVGVLVRRGTHDAEPSVCLRYSDGHLGLEGGYEVEVFTDYLGDTQRDSDEMDRDGLTTTSSTKDIPTATSKTDPPRSIDYDHDLLLDRRGATFRLQNPIPPMYIRDSVASASVERTRTRTGLHENIASTTLTVGPFRRFLGGSGARSSLSTTLTTGARVSKNRDTKIITSLEDVTLRPYSIVSASTQQIVPIPTAAPLFRRRNNSIITNDNVNQNRPPVVLAFQHSVMTSTHHLPLHEARALAHRAQIRGARPDSRVAASVVKGTTELRIPIHIPKIVGDASIVAFGDWFYTTTQQQQNLEKGRLPSRKDFRGKSSVGMGLRKNIQGLPLKLDVFYTPSDGKVRHMFGLGPDFDA